MNKCIFAVSSSTYALKGIDALEDAGIRGRMVKLPASQSPYGCAYGISVKSCDCRYAEEVLRKVIIFRRIEGAGRGQS